MYSCRAAASRGRLPFTLYSSIERLVGSCLLAECYCGHYARTEGFSALFAKLILTAPLVASSPPVSGPELADSWPWGEDKLSLPSSRRLDSPTRQPYFSHQLPGGCASQWRGQCRTGQPTAPRGRRRMRRSRTAMGECRPRSARAKRCLYPRPAPVPSES